MQWSRSLLIITLTAVALTEGAWKRNQEYNYKVFTKTLKNEKWDSFRARLTIRPESDETWIGKLSQAQFGEAQSSLFGQVWNRASNVTNWGNNNNNNNLRMEEPFKVKVKNGIVEALLVDRRWSETQFNQLKFVINAFVDRLYVDRNMQCQMDGENAFYNINEQTMLGDCDTIYEIAPLAEYLSQSSRDLVPLPELQRQGQFTDVVKGRDYSKCKQNRNTGTNENTNRESTLVDINRVILSGPLNDYTVQSSFSTLKATERLNSPPKTISYINITLESLNTNAGYPSISLDNLMDVQNNNSPTAWNNAGRIEFFPTPQSRALTCTSKHADFKQLTITPSFISIVGNTPITIQGPSLNDVVRVQIRFHDAFVKTVTATISGDKVTCMVPYLYTNGRVQVDMIVTRTNNVVETFYGFIYTEKHHSEMNFELISSTRIKMSWDKTKFNAGAPLKLELLELVDGFLTSRGVIKSNITNNGLFTGDLDFQGMAIIPQLRNLYVVKLESTLMLPSPTTVGMGAKSIVISNFLNQLSSKTQAEIDEMCLDWYRQDSGAPRDALPCPPTLQKARVDERFHPVDDLKLYNPDAEFGFMQRVPSKSGAAQRCVYKNGRLLVGPPSGGNVRKVSPNGEKGEVPHLVADIMPWFLCCNTNKANCNLYYEKRPSNNGSDYVDPHCGLVVGDPHFTTFDGLYYTFLGLGEFWIIKSQDNTFSMQGRFTQYLNTGATTCTVYVMQHRSIEGVVTIQLSLKKDYIEIMIDGQAVALDTNPNQRARTIAHKGSFIAINSQKDIRITFSSGHSFKFTHSPNVIDMVAMLDANLRNSFRGLFGNFDGNQANEFTYPDGRVIPKNSKAKDIYDYGMTWKVNCRESLFTYPDDKSYESFQDDKYVPKLEPLDVDKLPPKAKEVCGDNYECLFDFSVTGDLEMAVNTKTTVDVFTSIMQSLSVSCPKLNVPWNGYLEVRNNFLGSTAKLVCNNNFAVQGNDSIVCARNVQGQLTWQGSLGQCVQKNKCAHENTWLQWVCEHGLQE